MTDTRDSEVGRLEVDDVDGGPLTVDAVPPASGAWRDGDPAGNRLFLDLGALALESGASLPSV